MRMAGRWGWIIIIAMALPGTALASGAPFAPNGYTVLNGVISALCPAGAISCTDGVADNGFLQRQVETVTGTYIQFILTDPGVSGDASAAPFTAARGSLNFTNEDMVRMGNRGQGIASFNSIYASVFSTPTQEDRFSNVSEMLFGWANQAPDPWMSMHQSIQSVDYSVNPLNPTEIFLGTAEILSQNPGITDDGSNKQYQYVKLGATDAQKFQYARVDLFYQPTCHPGPCVPSFLPAVGSTPLLPGGTNGGDFTWNAFNKLAAVWVGQSLTDAFEQATGYTHFAQTDHNDIPLPSKETALFTFDSPEAIHWLDNPFGPVETMAEVHSVTPTAFVAPPAALTGTGISNPPPAGSFSSTPLGPPVDYGQWAISGGNITVTYDPGAVADVIGDGFMQRVITVGGERYIQTIVADTGATGDPNTAPFTGSGATAALGFQNESFVKIGVTDPAQQGVASKLHVEQQDLAYTSSPCSPYCNLLSTGGQFTYTAMLNTGWANGSPIAPILQVSQRTLVPDDLVNPLNNTSMDQRFDMKVGSNASDRDISIVSAVGTKQNGLSIYPTNNAVLCGLYGGTVSGANCIVPASGFNNPIMFITKIQSGVFQITTQNLVDPLLFTIDAGDGEHIAWSPGDAVQATWVGGLYDTPDFLGSAHSISDTSYTNLTTGERARYNYVSYPPYPLGAVVLSEPYSALFTFGSLLIPPPPWSYTYPAPPF